MDAKLYDYLLILGDSSLILGHRLSELCGHGPSLETDIALTNISLDLFGQVRSYFQYAAEIKGEGSTEDDIAFLRFDRECRNPWLMEQKNIDFAYVICRQYLFDQFHLRLLNELRSSADSQIAAIAEKSVKEVKYHLRFSESWMRRLALGTAESTQRMEAALNDLYPFAEELFQETETEKQMKELKIGPDLTVIKELYFTSVNKELEAMNLSIPTHPARINGGKKGLHSEEMGFILADLQYMQRAYPNMSW